MSQTSCNILLNFVRLRLGEGLGVASGKEVVKSAAEGIYVTLGGGFATKLFKRYVGLFATIQLRQINGGKSTESQMSYYRPAAAMHVVRYIKISIAIGPAVIYTVIVCVAS